MFESHSWTVLGFSLSAEERDLHSCPLRSESALRFGCANSCLMVFHFLFWLSGYTLHSRRKDGILPP